jgi:hypothetical protein
MLGQLSTGWGAGDEVWTTQTKRVPSPRVVVPACNSSTQEAEAGRSGDWDQPRLHNETLFQNTKTRANPRNLALMELTCL